MTSTEEKILSAALRVLAKQGYDKATTRKIAEESGFNEVTIFRKFHSKENLVKEAYKLSLENTMMNMDEIFASDEDKNFETNLLSLHEQLYNGINERSSQLVAELRRALIKQRMILNQDPDNTYTTMMRTRLSDYFQSQIEKGNMRKVNPDAAALIFFSVITFEKVLMKLVHDETSGLSNKDFLDIFLKGVSI